MVRTPHPSREWVARALLEIDQHDPLTELAIAVGPRVRISFAPAGSQVRTRPHDEIEPIEVEGFYQKPRCFPFPSHGVQDATPPGREWFLELIVEHLPSHRGPAMIGDTERLIPNLYREAAEELRQWARRARLTDIRSDLLELSARYERLASYSVDGNTRRSALKAAPGPQ